MPTLARAGWDQYLHMLIDQTTPADEYIIVVDRHTETEERGQMRGQWPNVIFLFNDETTGIAASLNRGLAHATGDIIFRADDDDIYRQDRIEKQLDCLRTSEADIVGSWAKGTVGENRKTSFLIKSPIHHDEIARRLKKRNILIHPSLAFRKKAILDLGGYDETFLYAQDYALYLQALRSGLRFANVPEPLVTRIYSSRSITIGQRSNQLMFSCAARIIDSANKGDRSAFFGTIFQYAILAATPNWARRLRKWIFGLTGTGV